MSFVKRFKDGKRVRERERVNSNTVGPSETKQSFVPECDINNLMRRYEKDKVLTHVNTYQGQYGDFGDVPSYQDAMNKVMAADEMFSSLPADIRDRFGNDPGRFIDFSSDDANYDDMVKMGLCKPRDPAPPVEVVVKNDVSIKKDDVK